MAFLRILFLGFFLFILSCSEYCVQEVEDIALIQNTTARELSLEVCLGTELGTQTITIPASQDGNLSLGAREVEYSNSDLGSGCNREEGEQITHTAYLTSAHFSDVKFCHPQQETENLVIVETSESCPTGTTEQQAASTACSSESAVSF